MVAGAPLAVTLALRRAAPDHFSVIHDGEIVGQPTESFGDG